jgi:hypothetical protein
LVKRLSIAFHNCDIFIPDNPILKGELESFTYIITDAGNIKYGAPKGEFDDCVCSLMLCNYGMNGGVALCLGGFESELTQEEYDSRVAKDNVELNDEFFDWDTDSLCNTADGDPIDTIYDWGESDFDIPIKKRGGITLY